MDERAVNPAGDRVVAGALVAVQLALLAVLLTPGPAAPRRPAGGPRAALSGLLLAGGSGLALSGALALGPALTPSPLPAASGQLSTGGPYGSLRHPIYTGLTVAAYGRAVGTGARRHGLAAVALAALFAVKGRFEERRLVERYPDYAEYARRTPAVARARGTARRPDRPGAVPDSPDGTEGGH